MKKVILFLSIISIVAVVSCNNKKEESIGFDPKVTKDSVDYVKEGEYLVMITGCNDCHTPKKMGPKGPELVMERMLSGYPEGQEVPVFDKENAQKGMAQMSPDMTAAAGPWGISFAANLTPDPTGIGTWSYEQFKLALTQGKHKGLDNGRMLLPPMPWFNYTNMKEQDIKAIYEYLKSIKPVKNVVPMPANFS